MEKSVKFAVVYVVLLAAFFAVITTGTLQDDEKECADQLANLAACIPYVSGTATEPTKKCCEDTLKVKNDKPKCLCVLIKESTDPAMALPVNTTLAMKMPSVCNIDAKVSDCPAILKLAPDSPDAKIFKDAEGSSTPTTATSPPASSASASPTTTTPTADSGSKATTASSDGAKLKSTASLVASVLMICCSAALILM